MGNKKLFIIDAMAMAFRNYHAFGVRQLTNSNGLPTSAVFGTAQFMNRLIENEAPDYILVATESGGKNFRHRLYPEYKANRKEMPDDLRIQLPWFFRLLESMGCRIITPEDHEADDVVGSAVKRYAGGDTDCYIVSGDKDFMQLINERVFLYTPRKGGEVKVIDDQGVEEKFGCSPQQVIDILSLMGDSSDNVPGVPGIGEKGASKLIQQYGSLEGIYDHLDEIKNKRQKQNLIEHRDLAFLSRDLVTIHTDLDLPSDKEAFAFRADEALAGRALLDIYEELEFVDLARKTLQRMGRQDAPGESRPAESGEEPNADAEAEPAPAVETDYQLVDNRRALQQLVPLLSGAEWYAFDTETTGLSVVSDRPVGLSFSVAPGQAFYVPLLEKHLGDDLRPDDVLAALAPVLKSKAAKVGHNCKFDIQMLRNAGLDVTGPFLDTMVASHLINPTTRGHGLDACCLRWLDYKKIPTEELIGKKAEIAMADVDLPLLTRYACEDADLTGRLYQRLEKELTQLDLMTVYKEIEMPLVPVLAGMEQEGIYIKVPELSHLSEKMAKRLEALTATIHELAGEEFNINSTKQLQVILFEKLRIHEELGIKRLKKTKSGFSTDFSVLQQLAAHPLPAALLEYRQISKLKSTYVDTLPELVHPDTGRIHTSYHQTGTATGRLSSSDPNLQNIPVRTAEGQEIRHAFQAADQQHVLLSADYSQIELRLLAHMAREENLTAAFRAGEDIHRATAARIFEVEPDQVDGEQRARAKAINFGLIYGMGARRLAAETGVSTKEASRFIERYFESYPKIRLWIDETLEFVRQHEFTRTMSGRRRPIPEINSPNRMTSVNARNVAINSPVQGSAADLIKMAMIRIDDKIRTGKLRLRMLLQVHDELVFECHVDDVEPARQWIREAMEEAMPLQVPLVVEMGSGMTWVEAH